MKNKKILSIALMAFVFSLVAISTQTTATDEIYNFIAGNNIIINQLGNTITITGAATWTLSGITTDLINGAENSCKLGLLCTPENPNTNLNIVSDYTWVFGRLYINNYNLSNISNKINSIDTINSNQDTKINQINSSVQIVKQTAFEAKINTTQMASDKTRIPYDFILKNISVNLDNNTGYLNFSVKRYSVYPNSNETLFIINNSAYDTVNTGNNTLLNRGNIIELIYTNWSKINSAIITFELDHYI